MAITSTQVASDGVVQKPLEIEKIHQGIIEKLFLTKLLTDVSSSFVPGADQFTAYQWGMAGAVENTLENGNEQTDGGMPVYKQVIPCDQDKKNSLYTYDKATLISALNYDTGFFATAPIQHARALDQYVSGLMRAAADVTIKCNADDELDEEVLSSLALAMDEAKLPKEGRVLIVRSKQKYALIRNFKLADSSIAGSDRELREGNTSRLYGFDIYEDNTNILPTASAADNQAMAFVKDACFWGLQKEVETEVERQASKSRDYLGCRSKYGAKANTFPNADGATVKRVYLIGEQA